MPNRVGYGLSGFGRGGRSLAKWIKHPQKQSGAIPPWPRHADGSHCWLVWFTFVRVTTGQRPLLYQMHDPDWIICQFSSSALFSSQYAQIDLPVAYVPSDYRHRCSSATRQTPQDIPWLVASTIFTIRYGTIFTDTQPPLLHDCETCTFWPYLIHRIAETLLECISGTPFTTWM